MRFFQFKRRPLIALTTLTALVLAAFGCKEAGEPVSEAAKMAAKGSTLVTNCDFIEPNPEESARHYQGSYVFSEDWFTPNVPAWRGALGHLRGRPDIRYLEVGLYEGRSAIWMLENILTDPTSHLTGIDVFPGDLEERWMANVDRSGKASQVTTIKGYSQRELRTLPPESFDAIYIDGSHTGYDVLADAILAWDLLKEGGVIIFDDYQWRRGGGLPPELKPGPAIDAFLTMYRDFLVVIHRCYQLAAFKQNNPCSGIEYCSPIGSYTYSWKEEILKTAKGIRKLTGKESRYIKTLLNSRGFGQTNVIAPPELLKEEEFIPFIRRLKLDFVLPEDPELQLLRHLYGPARYSQNDEELFIRDYFKNEWDGFFVDMTAVPRDGNSSTLFLERHLGWKGIVMDDAEKITDAEIRLRDLMEREGIDHFDFLNVERDFADMLMSQKLDILRYKPDLVCVAVHEPGRNSIERFVADHDYASIEKYSLLDPLHLYFSPR